ncbi:MAG: ETC complex I subunit [Alphaproteobacteria bacterium]|nr:ETC complex I subunit [Alphaproteobacteria bacterium]
MTTVRIYQPTKTAMQSGKRKTKEWRVEFETNDPLIANPLMGWIQSYDMSQELRLSFPSLREALEFATTRGFGYTICTSPQTIMSPKSYATNFTCPRIRGC